MDATVLAHELREELLPITFVCCVIGLWDALWNQEADLKSIIGAIFRVLVVVILVWQYPIFIDSARDALSGFREGVFSKAGESEFQKVLTAQIQDHPKTWDFTGQICAALVHSLQGLGQVMLSILMFLQDFCLRALIAVSPLLLGFLGWSLTRPMGIQFCFTTVGILLWEVGVLIVDILLLNFGQKYLQPALAAGATISVGGIITGVVSWPLFLSAVVIAALIPAFLYLSVPFIIATVLRGGDPTGPLLLKAMQMATMAPTAAAMMPKMMGSLGSAAPSLGNLFRNGSMLTGPAISSGGSSVPGVGQAPANCGTEGNIVGEGLNAATPLTGSASEKSGACGHSAPLGPVLPSISMENSFGKRANEKSSEKSQEPTVPIGGTYVGKHGHVFTQLTPTAFSCEHPRTGFTSHHEGNIGCREVANNAVLRHNMKRMTAGDMKSGGRQRQPTSKATLV